MKILLQDLQLDKITLKCKDCGKSFDINHAEIEWHFDRDLEVLELCPKCQKSNLRSIMNMCG